MSEPMTKELLLQFLKQREQMARETILESGRFIPLVELMVPKENVRIVTEEMELDGFSFGDESAPYSVVCVVCSVNPGDLLSLYECVCLDKERRAVVRELRQAGARAKSAETADKFLLEQVLKVMHLHDAQDLFEATLKIMCKRLDAYAMLRTSEAWTLQKHHDGPMTEEQAAAYRMREKYPDMKDHPDSVEVLMLYLESRSFVLTRALPINRKRPKDESSRILSIGEQLGPDKELADFGGRMTGAVARGAQ